MLSFACQCLMWPGEDLGSLDGKPSQTRRDHWWGLPFPCPGAPTGSKSPRFASSASGNGEMLLRKCWLGTLSLFGTMPGVGKKQWNCPVEERKVLWKASFMLLCGSLDKGKSISSSFQGFLETVLLQDRNTFVGTNIKGMKLKWPILPLLPEISEASLFAGVVHLYIIFSFPVYWSFSPSPECTVIIFPFGECEEWTVSAAQWLDCIKPGKKEPLFWGRADNCRFWFIPVELLLWNQAVISHLQPITKLSIPKQFAYREIYKSWLTLQGKLHWVCRQRASASSWVPSWAHWGWQGGSGCPEPGGQDQLPWAEQCQLCRLCHFHAPSSVGGVCFLRSWWHDEPSLRAGIFPKRFCMLELGTDLHEEYLTALTTPCPLQWDYPPFLLLSAGFSLSEKPQTPWVWGKLLPAQRLFLPKWKWAVFAASTFTLV